MADLIDQPLDLLGNILMVGDKVAIAVMGPEMVVGEIVAIKTHTEKGKPYTVWRNGKSTQAYAIKVRLDARGGKLGKERLIRKHGTYEHLHRVVRIGAGGSDFDYDAFVASLKATEEGLR